MNEIAITHSIELSKVHFDDDDTQFVLDWIIAHGKEEELAEHLNDCNAFAYMDTYYSVGTEDDFPLWTTETLERLLRGFDPDSGDPYLGNFELEDYNKALFKKLGVPEPTPFQFHRHVMPSGYCNGSGSRMRSMDKRPIDSETIERMVMYHLGKGVISIDIQSSMKPDAE